MTNYFAVFGNNLVVLSCLVGLFYAIIWINNKKITKLSKRILGAWILMLVAISIRSLFWPLAGYFSLPSKEFHPLFVAYKGYMLTFVGIVFSFGVIGFVHIIRPFRTEIIAIFIVSIALISFIFAH